MYRLDSDGVVADWSPARIGYTWPISVSAGSLVADWSRAEIGYTLCKYHLLPQFVGKFVGFEAGYTSAGKVGNSAELRIGREQRLVTLKVVDAAGRFELRIAYKQEWLHLTGALPSVTSVKHLSSS